MRELKRPDDGFGKADALRQKIEEIENQYRAGGEAGTPSCPPSVPEESKPAVTKAMNLLLYRPRTEKELRDRLEREGFQKEEADCAVAYVSYFGYLNDWKYAENYVLSGGSGKSRAVLRSELSRKGVGEGPIEAAMELLETDDRTVAEQLLRKRYGEPHPMEEKELRRAAGFLGRRGFASSVVWGVLREYQKE